MLLDDDSFVDLYEVLEIAPEAEAAALRRRISELYLEARDNLEHENHRKRFYYRELYEIHLPHAHLLLLDAQKRVAYDEQLKQFIARRGRPATPRKPRDNKYKSKDLPSSASSSAPSPTDDFSDFADADDEIVLPPPRRPALQMDAAEIGRRRDIKRRELIKHEIIANGFKWGIMGGLATLAGGAFFIFLLNAFLPGGILRAFGFPLPVFIATCALFIGALAVFAARQTMRWARRRTVGYLSTLPYDELLRVCRN